jgi:hypothetical protein
MKSMWEKFGSVLEWFGVLATLALVWFQVSFSNQAKEYALEARLFFIEEKLDESCRLITSELLDLRNEVLDGDRLTAYVERRQAAEAGFDREYPFTCIWDEYAVQPHSDWPSISKAMSRVETWMIGTTAILAIIGLLVKSRAKSRERA